MSSSTKTVSSSLFDNIVVVPDTTAAMPSVVAAATPAPVVSAPGGVVISDVTGSLAAVQGSTGLTAKTALASMTAAGGIAGDPVKFTLGGTGASAFTLTTTSSVGTLSTGSVAVAGGTNGKAYALTLTATDTTTGLSSKASAFDVVVGGAGADTVSVAKLVGSASTAAPTFIYGIAGNDTLNGTGMTGKLYFDGGAGADTMTGGTGVNTYVYGAPSDSTASAMDIITNFAANKDVIDLTGIGTTKLTFAGALTGASLAADSIGYAKSGANTFVYVNTSGASEALTATSMKIELAGSVTLGAGNFLHH